MKRVIASASAPAPLGPYSQAILVDGLVFCAGQIGWDPGAGGLVRGGTAAEAEQAIRNLAGVLEAAGLGLADVVKTTIFLADIGDGAIVNAVYERYFGEPRPARSTVGVAALPAGARIEIEAIATRGG